MYPALIDIAYMALKVILFHENDTFGTEIASLLFRVKIVLYPLIWQHNNIIYPD